MKKIVILSLSICVLAMASCTKSDTGGFTPASNSAECPESGKTIPLEDALGSLSEFLNGIGDGTRADISKIRSCDIAVVGGNSLTRSASSGYSIPDTLAYVINFGDGQGAAVLAANSRLSSSVICVLDSGELDPAAFELTDIDFNNLANFPPEQDRIMSDDEPDGFVCARETSEGTVERMLMGNILSDYEEEEDCEEDVGDSDGGEELDYHAGGYGITKYGPYLKTKWGQGDPFNNLVAPRFLGCVATAVAQIIVNQRPRNVQNMKFNDKQCDWNTLESVRPYTNSRYKGTAEAQSQVANFCYDIQNTQNCDIWPAKDNNGFGTSFGAKRTFCNFGFSNVTRYCGFGETNMEIAKEKIKQGYPVFLYGAFPVGNGFFKHGGHAFVLDGLYYFDGREHFHVNWGWEGKSDGYFVCGVFNTANRVSSDRIDSGATGNICEIGWFFRMVTYEN